MKRMKTQFVFENRKDGENAEKIIKSLFPRRPIEMYSRTNKEYVIKINLDCHEMTNVVEELREKNDIKLKYGRCL